MDTTARCNIYVTPYDDFVFSFEFRDAKYSFELCREHEIRLLLARYIMETKDSQYGVLSEDSNVLAIFTRKKEFVDMVALHRMECLAKLMEARPGSALYEYASSFMATPQWTEKQYSSTIQSDVCKFIVANGFCGPFARIEWAPSSNKKQ